jgi:hypothetical protein
MLTGYAFMAGCFPTILFWLIHWLIVLPVILLVTTPFVLVAAMFDSLRYDRAVFGRYRSICLSFAEFWDQIGHHFTP